MITLKLGLMMEMEEYKTELRQKVLLQVSIREIHIDTL